MTCLQWRARRLAGALAVPLMLGGVLSAVSAIPASASRAAGSGSWTAVEPLSPGAANNLMEGVAVLSASDAWAVGSYASPNSNVEDLIEHWNGSAWSVVPSPDPGTAENYLDAVSVVSASDIWAVGEFITEKGEYTLTLHWNGTAWSHVASPSPGSWGNELDGIKAVSADDIWAVGNYSNSEFGLRSLILHWNGTSWSRVPSPAPGASSQLYAVTATSSSSVWAVGSAGAELGGRAFILRWNGTSWTQVSAPHVGGAQSALLGVDATSAVNAFAVGEVVPAAGEEQTLILRWNGTTWTRTASPDPRGLGALDSLAGVTATSATSAWAVGDENYKNNHSLILQWNGKTWARVASPNPAAGGSLLSVAASSPANAWAVGQYGGVGKDAAFALHCCTSATRSS